MVLNHGDDGGYDFEERIDFALCSSLHVSPHNNHIAALAIALDKLKLLSPEFKVSMQQLKKNAKALPSALFKRKCRSVTCGTDNHPLLWDLTALGLIGTRAMTSRGCLEGDFVTIADFLFRTAQITSTVQTTEGTQEIMQRFSHRFSEQQRYY